MPARPTHKSTHNSIQTRFLVTFLAAGLVLGSAGASAATAQQPAQPPAQPTTSQPEAEPAVPGFTARSIDTITAQFRKHGLATAPEKPAGTIRLATYNIHELFDDVDDPDLTGRQEDIGRVMIESRRAATSHALRGIDADIVALQEVESLEALEWYRDGNLADLGYTHAASVEVGHPLGLEQAVLSRYPIVATQTWTDRVIGTHPDLYRGKPSRYAGEPLTFRRSPLMAEIALIDDSESADLGIVPEAQRVTLLVVHFKTGEGSDAWRAAEGAAVAAILGELKADRPDRRVIVLGDFASGDAEGHLAPVLDAGLKDVFAASGTDLGSKDAVTSIEGDRACGILVGPGVTLAEGSTPFVVGTVVPPDQLDRRRGFRMPGFASDHYPVACDLAAPTD